MYIRTDITKNTHLSSLLYNIVFETKISIPEPGFEPQVSSLKPCPHITSYLSFYLSGTDTNLLRDRIATREGDKHGSGGRISGTRE